MAPTILSKPRVTDSRYRTLSVHEVAYVLDAARPAFEGAVELPITVDIRGKRSVRRARVRYRGSPSWAHFDPKGELRTPPLQRGVPSPAPVHALHSGGGHAEQWVVPLGPRPPMQAPPQFISSTPFVLL